MIAGLELIFALSLMAPSELPPVDATRSYAVIVGSNAGADVTLERLRYADDDAARYHELFSLVAARAEILSVLDPETQKIYPSVARRARIPSRNVLLDTLASVFADISRDEAQGRRTAFYFVFVGHGSIAPDGEGVVHLLDGRFSRSDLYQEVVSRSPARVNHVVIDACNAYFMVARRGAAGVRAETIDEAVKGFLSREGLERHPNTGVLVSTSHAADVHEWARFEAGIFSHEVRSALVGAADLDGDRLVTYEEARAFIGAANARILDPKAKLSVYARPPAIHQAEPLFDLRAARGAPSVAVPGTLGGHRWLEDARGVRYADFNVASDGPVRITLVPSPLYFLRSETDEIRLPLEVARDLDASAMTTMQIEIARRGSEELSFQRDLFAVSFGRGYLEGYRASLPIEPVSVERAEPLTVIRPRSLAAIGLAVGGMAAAASGVFFGLHASERAERYRSAIGAGSEISVFRNEAANAARNANILYVASGALAAGAALLWFWPDAP